MRTTIILALTLLQILAAGAPAPLPVLKRSDVVFMYQASRPTYEDYGATVLAWGGKPTTKSLEEARGLKFFASVGMVTEFSRYYERFPQDYEQGLCRDEEGKPYKVPWLTDHQHKGIPFWWCCTRQPLFRKYLSERVVETVKAGAHGVHIDDHLGTAGGIWEGGCFCDRCLAEFRDYLEGFAADELDQMGIKHPGQFNYREAVRDWLKQNPGRKATGHPLWSHWRIYQFRGAAQFMAELRALAAKTAGRSVPMGANAGLLWGPHLADYHSFDLFSAEIDHHAGTRQLSDDPLVAYRLADAVGRPLASTASGGDWAFIKEHNLPGLVQSWIASSYAAGHGLMAPNRQWCYTLQKGTHWYEGPKVKYAPLYRFVRDHAALFDGYENTADLTVAFSQRTFDRAGRKIISSCNQLAAANLSYRIALGGDEIVHHPLRIESLGQTANVLVLEVADFTAADRQVLGSVKPARRFETVERALAGVVPAVRVEAPGPLRVFPRVKRGAAVIHLVNWGYQAAEDRVRPLKAVRLQVNLAALGCPGATEARVFAPGAASLALPVCEGRVVLPELGLWGLLELQQN
jgi:hypothetical protein